MKGLPLNEQENPLILGIKTFGVKPLLLMELLISRIVNHIPRRTPPPHLPWRNNPSKPSPFSLSKLHNYTYRGSSRFYFQSLPKPAVIFLE
jgi:hypothetical protein